MWRDTVTKTRERFNPRAPYGARHGGGSRGHGDGNFNPRAPYGARPMPSGANGLLSLFQPTRPLRGATHLDGAADRLLRISTHAPLAGRDWAWMEVKRRYLPFQPTRPLRGATIKPSNKSDHKDKFQPTRPLRGATLSTRAKRKIYKFQPTRPLRGATV